MLKDPLISLAFFTVSLYPPVIDAECYIKKDPDDGNKKGKEQVCQGFIGALRFKNNSQANQDKYGNVEHTA